MYALHLRRYNDALLIHDTVRAVDAMAALRDFYDRERATKTQFLHAERWLLTLFDGEAPPERGGAQRRLEVRGQAYPQMQVGKMPARVVGPYFSNPKLRPWI